VISSLTHPTLSTGQHTDGDPNDLRDHVVQRAVLPAAGGIVVHQLVHRATLPESAGKSTPPTYATDKPPDHFAGRERIP
jgi:hypothetical protein